MAATPFFIEMTTKNRTFGPQRGLTEVINTCFRLTRIYCGKAYMEKCDLCKRMYEHSIAYSLIPF